MAVGKKSFILYLTQRPLFEGLSNEDAGKLIKLLFEYVSDEQPEIPNNMAGFAFNAIKPILKDDLNTWNETIKQRSDAGKKHTGNQYTRAKENGTNGTSVPKLEQNGTNGTVNVIDNVIVNDNVIDIKKETILTDSKEKRLEIVECKLGRTLGALEIERVCSWSFSNDAILEALEIAINNKANRPIDYANNILLSNSNKIIKQPLNKNNNTDLQNNNINGSGSEWLDNFIKNN